MSQVPPEVIEVKGREGFNDKRLNGEYYKRPTEINTRSAYTKRTKEENKMVIWFWSAKKVWMMTRETMINTDSAYACVKDDANDPTLIKAFWKVFDKKVGKHVTDKKMKIIDISHTRKKVDQSEIEKLKKSNLELKTQIEELKKVCNKLQETIETQEEQIDRQKDEVEDVLTMGEYLESDFNKKCIKHQNNKQEFKKLAQKYAKIQKWKQNNVPKECKSFKTIQEIAIEPDKLKRSLLEALKNHSVKEWLEIFSSSQTICVKLKDRLENAAGEKS